MADYDIVNETIWPTVNDVAQTAGDGKGVIEQKMVSLYALLAQRSYVVSGLTVPASSGNLNIDVALGKAVISGFHVNVPGATTVTVGASVTSYIFLKLLKDGNGNVTGAKFEVNTTGTAPADSLRLALAVSSGSAITLTSDLRVMTNADDPYEDPESLVITIKDDFMACSTDIAANFIGGFTSQTAWWIFNSGNPTLQAHGGRMGLSGQSECFVPRTVGGAYPGATVTFATFIDPAKDPTIKFRMTWMSSGSANNNIFGGMADGSFGGSGANFNPGNGIYIRVQGSGNYFAVCRKAGVETTLDTGIASTANTMRNFRLVTRGGGTSVEVFVDGVSKGFITSNIPTVLLGMGFGVSIWSFGQSMDFDSIEMTVKR